jgi:hypothetical protein
MSILRPFDNAEALRQRNPDCGGGRSARPAASATAGPGAAHGRIGAIYAMPADKVKT